MMMYGPAETWKIVYYPKDSSNIQMGVALVEADCEQTAYQAFYEQYAGMYRGIQSVKKLLG
jgi:hypothetical protein